MWYQQYLHPEGRLTVSPPMDNALPTAQGFAPLCRLTPRQNHQGQLWRGLLGDSNTRRHILTIADFTPANS